MSADKTRTARFRKGSNRVSAHVCPWWSAWLTIDNPLRRLVHDPRKIVGPYVKPGMTALDVGCGSGWFSIPMARMAGQRGRVIAVDLQQQMLDMLRRRAQRAGVADRIRTHKCESGSLGLDARADFALAFAMVHEVPDTRRLLAEIHACLKPGGRFFVAEPRLHVASRTFQKMLEIAAETGFRPLEEPQVARCRAVVLATADARGQGA